MRPSSAGTIPTFAKDFIGEDSPATLPPPASMPSLSGLGSLSDGMTTALAPAGSSTVLRRDASGTASSETPMPSLSETGSEGMPTALPPPESMTVVLSARDACQPQNARG